MKDEFENEEKSENRKNSQLGSIQENQMNEDQMLTIAENVFKVIAEKII